MRVATWLAGAIVLFAQGAHAQQNIPTMSSKTYGTPGAAAAGGGAYNITRNLGGRGLISEFGRVGSRGVNVVTPTRGNTFKIQTKKLNPDNNRPLASTSVSLIKSNRGKFRFLHGGRVQFNLPIVLTAKSRASAAKGAAAKAFLGDSSVKRWYAEDGLQGADVMSVLRSKLVRTTPSGKTAYVDVYHRSNGQDGEPFMQATVKVRKLRSGLWRADPNVNGMFINDIWE
jgi:hypothetical protein